MAQINSELATSGTTRDAATTYKAGDEADFERLYQTSYSKIVGTLVVMLGDRAAAEDCAHDAFERAYKKWPTWQPIAPAEAWVHRIAVNGAVSYLRKMRIREVGELIRRIGRPGVAPDPQALAEHRDLTDALAQLPHKQAVAIVLRHYHGYTNRAIALVLGVPERTVASRLAVAKTRLRAILQRSYGPEAGIEDPTGRPALVAAAD
ncbi:MAG: RNA polymerase sigma factor [Candidatus Dormibacteraceae bacterium]